MWLDWVAPIWVTHTWVYRRGFWSQTTERKSSWMWAAPSPRLGPGCKTMERGSLNIHIFIFSHLFPTPFPWLPCYELLCSMDGCLRPCVKIHVSSLLCVSRFVTATRNLNANNDLQNEESSPIGNIQTNKVLGRKLNEGGDSPAQQLKTEMKENDSQKYTWIHPWAEGLEVLSLPRQTYKSMVVPTKIPIAFTIEMGGGQAWSFYGATGVPNSKAVLGGVGGDHTGKSQSL